jgi:hypothetical protein
MSGGIVRLSFVVAAVLVVSAPAAASPKFNGNVCALLTPAQVTAITGVSAKCNNQPPLPGMGAKTYVGDWAALMPKGPTLQVTVSVYSNPGWLAKAIHNLEQGMNGPPKKVTGIGLGAYEATGSYAVGIHTYVGKNLIYISLSEVGKTPSSPALIAGVTKDVVAKLS